MAGPVQNTALRATLIGAYRFYARAQIWRKGPRVLINSVPKAGTHLLTSMLGVTPQLQDSRLWIENRFVNALAPKHERTRRFALHRPSLDRYLATIRNGQFAVGHFDYYPEILDALNDADIRTVFVIRHPLDIIVSKFHYIKALRRHAMHDYFVGLPSDDDRLDLLIRGSEQPESFGLADELRAFKGWLDAPGVFTVRFEDLVGSRGGGDDIVRRRTQATLLEFLGLPPDAFAKQESRNSSATFRKGWINAWSDLLTPERLSRLSEDDKDAIREYGYDI